MPNPNVPQNQVIDESMQRALNKILAERPDIKRPSLTASNSLGGMFTGMMMPRGAIAVTNPFTGNITYSPKAMAGQSDRDIEQTVAHELTHTKQAQDTPWYKTAMSMFMPDEKVPAGISQNSPLNDPYQWRPAEMEAYQEERNRAARTNYPYYVDPVTGSRDLQLPNMKKPGMINTGPSSTR